MQIVYWENMVSPHMMPLLAELTELGYKVTYVAEEMISQNRAKTGWLPGHDKRVKICIINNNINEIVESYSYAVHIVAGVIFSGKMEKVRRSFWSFDVRWGSILEVVDERSRIKALLKRGIYNMRLNDGKKSPDFVLSIGRQTPDWIATRGYPAEEIFPFSYFISPPGITIVNRSSAGEPFRIGFVGRLIPRKRVDLLIEALAEVTGHDFELVIVGDGSLGEDIKRLADERLGAGKFVMPGKMPMSEIPVVMNSLDCFVLPSDHDGWGVVVTEALMAGVPAMCSAACGAAEAVSASGIGGVFPKGDVAALRSLLVNMMDRGRMEKAERLKLAHWARCFGAKAGAEYLAGIVKNVYADQARPEPPWRKNVSSLRL